MDSRLKESDPPCTSTTHYGCGDDDCLDCSPFLQSRRPSQEPASVAQGGASTRLAEMQRISDADCVLLTQVAFDQLTDEVVALRSTVTRQSEVIERLSREVVGWRWIAWKADTSWACTCGDIHGRGITEPCEVCGTHRPAPHISTETGLPKNEAELAKMIVNRPASLTPPTPQDDQ